MLTVNKYIMVQVLQLHHKNPNKISISSNVVRLLTYHCVYITCMSIGSKSQQFIHLYITDNLL